MRKRILVQEQKNVLSAEEKWLDLSSLAQVEVTSEEPESPIEAAFEQKAATGRWRAAEAGKQMVRIIFDEPQQIKTIYLHFREEQLVRTQEFLLHWSPDEEQSFREIVRQQYNFSPGSATEEQETYSVNLDGVRVVELILIPDVNGGSARASVEKFWIG